MAAAGGGNEGLKDIGAGGGGGATDDKPKAQYKSDEGDNKSKAQWVIDLNRSLTRNGRDAHSRYIQLATVSMDEAGKIRPALRTIVFRGFHPGTEVR